MFTTKPFTTTIFTTKQFTTKPFTTKQFTNRPFTNRPVPRVPRHLAGLVPLVIALGLSACGQPESDTAVQPISATPTTATPTTATPTTATPTTATPTTAAPTTLPAGPTDLGSAAVPGEAIDYGPEAGRPLTIVGVAADDVLHFRLAPSPDATIVASHPVTLTELDVYALGEAWAAPTGVWWKVNVMGTEAWANQAYLAVRGGSVPIFDEVAQDLQILMSGSIEDLALDVAATRATAEPESRITMVTGAVITPLGDGGGTGYVFVDVLDIGDHMQKGERLRVEVHVVFDLDTPEPDDIAFVVLEGVEMIYLQAL